MYSLLLTVLIGLNVESRIDSVVVYRDQAMVIRKATVTVTGSDQLVFAELPEALDDNSVRIRASGLLIGEVQVKRGYAAKPTPDVKRLQDSLDGLRRQDQAFADEQEVLKAKETFLNSIKLGAPELLSKDLSVGKVDATSWSAALAFLANEMLAVKKRSAELERLRNDLGKQIHAVGDELDAVRARYENRKTIAVDVTTEQARTCEVALSYRVPSSVAWSPYYELRAAPVEQNVDVTYYAQISQRTNEDWKDVRLVLSTARPTAGGVAPEAVIWPLDIYVPAPTPVADRSVLSRAERPVVRTAVATSRAMTSSDMSRLPVSELSYLAGAQAGVAQPLETGISLQYAIPGTVSLKSGEDPKKLFIQETTLPSEFSFYAYPRGRDATFLRGKLHNNSDFIFLAGQANTYVGDEFTGKIPTGNIAPGESASISFGVDDRVKVRRDLVKTFTSRTGLLGDRTKVDFIYRTTVENFHSAPVTMTLIDQIPVSRHKDIRVNVVTLDPKSGSEDRNKGTYTYKFELKPQEKFVVNLSFSVDYPADERITGLY